MFCPCDIVLIHILCKHYINTHTSQVLLEYICYSEKEDSVQILYASSKENAFMLSLHLSCVLAGCNIDSGKILNNHQFITKDLLHLEVAGTVILYGCFSNFCCVLCYLYHSVIFLNILTATFLITHFHVIKTRSEKNDTHFYQNSSIVAEEGG